MLFIGFTSAYIVRRSGADWRPLEAPFLLWVNTAVLLASSASLERARRLLRAWDLAGTRSWMAATGVLGGLFVAGQWLAWRQLAGQGIYLSSNPHSSFFYLLTGLHLLHLAGGLVWFGALVAKLSRMGLAPGPDGLRLFATYWHFLAALWIYLLFLLFVA
jgi:cytochrome c oxidase subunit 3